MSIRVTTEGWPQAYRIVSSRFPPIGVYDDVASAEDLEALYWVEGLTNPRIREEMGQITLVPEADRIAGHGTTPIMAAFTHLNPSGSRFTDGSYGVYYAGRDEDTAIAETIFHASRWAAESHDPPTSFVMRVYVGELKYLPYHDIREAIVTHPDIYTSDPTSYAPAQKFAAELRANGSWGLLYGSIRNEGGECIAAFRPNALEPVRQSKHLAYEWDGSNIVDVIHMESRGLP